MTLGMAPAAGSGVRRVLIDTDPGLDDAVAILYALAAPGLRVEGITTVAGNIGLQRTTDNALKLLTLAQREEEVPVMAGASAPLARAGRDESRIHGLDGLGGVRLPEARLPAKEAEAVEWLSLKLLFEPAGSLDLLCLGPLTNLARLIRYAPAAVERLGQVVVMGGALEVAGNVGPRSEFNLAWDPEAAAVVLAAGLDLTLVPLDVTRRVRADAAWLARLAAAPQEGARTVSALVSAYFDATTDAARPESRPLHDPCVPVRLLRPDLFGLQERRLAVDPGPTRDAGALVVGPHPVQLALRVDGPAVLQELAAVLERPDEDAQG